MLILLAVTFVVTWLVCGAFAEHRRRLQFVEYERQIASARAGTARALLRRLANRYGFSADHAACWVADTTVNLGPFFEQEFNIRWSARNRRWFVPRGPRQPKEAEPRVDLSEDESRIAEGMKEVAGICREAQSVKAVVNGEV